jgi:MFS transporter, ACS family, glucarate transporter
MAAELSSPTATDKPTQVRYGVLGFVCTLSMVTYLDRVCFGNVLSYIQSEFHMTDSDVSLLVTAFSLAYAAFEVPTGWLGDVFGPRVTLIRVVLWWSFFTALTGLVWPIVDWPTLPLWLLVAIRFFFGVGEAGAYPNIAKAIHNWFPAGDRAFAKGAVWMAGRLMGGTTPFLIYFMLYTDAEGTVHWRHVFWIAGCCGVIWCMAFAMWFTDRPESKPSVNHAELDLIRGPAGLRGPSPGSVSPPWRRILTSGNLWLLCAMYFCASYGWYFNINYLPKYLREEFGVDPTANRFRAGLLAGSPLLFGSVACLVGGILSDAFIRRTGNRKWGRRLFGIVGHATCGLCYFASIYMTNVYLFVLAIAMASFFNDLTMGASWASCLDIGKRFSGIVAGCMNTVGNLGGAAAAFLTGQILNALPKDKPLAWQINFLSFAAVYLLAAFCWLFFDATKPVCDD